MPDDQRTIAEWTRTGDRAEALLDLPVGQRLRYSIDQWEQLRLNLTLDRELALALGERGTLAGRIAQAQLAKLDATLPEGQAELDWVKQRRAELNNRVMTADSPAMAARAIEARNGVLIHEIDQILRHKRRQLLFSHSYPVLSASTWKAAGADITSGAIIGGAAPGVRHHRPELAGIPLVVRAGLLLAIACAAIWSAMRCRRALRAVVDRRTTTALSPRGRLGIAFARDLLDIAIPTAVLLVVVAGVNLLIADLPYIAALTGQVIYAGLTVVFTHWLGRSIFRPAFAPAQLVQVADDKDEAAIGTMTLLGVALAMDGVVEQIGQVPGTSPAVTSLVLFPILMAIAILTLRFARFLNAATEFTIVAGETGRHPRSAGRSTDIAHPAAWIMTAAAIFGVLAALLGYMPLARYVLLSTLTSLGVIGTAMFLYHSLTEASELLFGKREGGGSRYLQLLPLAFGFILFVLTVPIVAIIWGVSAERIVDGILALKNGVAVGQVQVSFGSVMTFAITFLLGYALTRWLQRVLHFAVLDRLRIEAGARAAVLTGFGYLGLTLSALLAITTAGLDLSSLAFIAGALSVGVGFGLQSVVANFVSGIILLIERPIKVGDWVQIGDYSGHVRRVAFRSTHIETFDRHEVIIPNSDLISGSVTNLTYGGSMGRIILPLGVAYGSDVERARQVLLEVMAANDRVLDDPAPTVVLDSLGDSAINLQAMCFVGDVNRRLGVRSDLYFAMLSALNAADISIPFPQREVWVHSAGGGNAGAQPAGAGI